MYNIDRTYDANGSLNTLKYPDSATTIAYAPNALGRPTAVGSYATAITYHPNGAIATFNYGNGIAHSLTQNTRGLPRQSSDVGVMNDVYDYDTNANVATITDQQQALTTRTMGYDDIDRLTSVFAPSLWGTATYGYDGLDNLTSSTITAGTTARTSIHSIDPSTNRLSDISSSTRSFSFGYGYDTRGNITHRGSQGYVFDIGNRLRSATGKATYSYDGFGRRTTVAQTDGINRSQVYGLDGKLYYASQTGDSKVPRTTRYIYLGSHLLAEVDSVSGTQYAHTDALGSPVARTDAVRAVLNRTRYEPYGYVAAGAGGTIGFTGHVNDVDTGLTYMEQRYYDPVAGRFLSVDPVMAGANTGTGFNRYAYANNSPYRYIDPDGRFAFLIPLIPYVATATVAIVGHYVLPGRQGREETARAVGNAILNHGNSQKPAADANSNGGTNSEGAKDGEKSGSKDGAKDPAKPGREKDVPNRGEPGEVKEGERRTREYGPDGKPLRDYDKPHQGYDRPHVHEWPGGQREHPGRDYSPWPRQ